MQHQAAHHSTRGTRPAVVALLVMLASGLMAPLAAAQPAQPASPPPAGPGLLDVIGQDEAVLVRMHGECGQKITALGLRRVLDYAKRDGIRHVVLWLDSAGGRDISGRAMAAQMAELDGDFDFHAVIDRAQGPAVFVVAAADTVWTLPGGHAGAVLSYALAQPQPAPSGPTPPEVVTLANELTATAARKGRPGDVFRAMVDPLLELWVLTRAGGERRFTLAKPASQTGMHGLWQVDTNETVVALSSAELHELGLAREASRGDVQHLLANQPFEVDRMLEAASRTVAGLISRRDSAIERAMEPLDKPEALMERARAARRIAEACRPEFPILDRDARTGELTRTGQRRWHESVDQCIAHWQAYQSLLKAIGDAEKDHVRLTRAANTQAARFHADLLWPAPEELTPSDIADEAELDVLWREAEAEIRRLRVERGRVR